VYIASLISHQESAVLQDTLLAHLCAELPRAGLVNWLAPGVAAEIPFVASGAALTQAWTTAGDIIGDLPVDLNIVPAGERRKKLLVADMDSTMIEQECVDELAELMGIRAEVAAITERAMRGEIAFEPALRERVAMLKGLEVAALAQVVQERVTITPGARTLVATMRAHGAHTALVSGGFTLFTGPVAKAIGFDEHRGNVLNVTDDLLDGSVANPVLGAESKLATLIELREKLGLASEQTLAVGDGANDLAMLEEAGLGVAYRAKPAVISVADASIRHGDLTALLYLQGYRADEFAAA
jgi:phosphoserine phosphatase